MIKTLIGLAVAAAIAFVSNPSPERHREQLKQAIAERSQLLALLHIGDVAAFASTYHTLGVASYAKVGDRVVSVGAFGIVYVPELKAR